MSSPQPGRRQVVGESSHIRQHRNKKEEVTFKSNELQGAVSDMQHNMTCMTEEIKELQSRRQVLQNTLEKKKKRTNSLRAALDQQRVKIAGLEVQERLRASNIQAMNTALRQGIAVVGQLQVQQEQLQQAIMQLVTFFESRCSNLAAEFMNLRLVHQSEEPEVQQPQEPQEQLPGVEEQLSTQQLEGASLQQPQEEQLPGLEEQLSTQQQEGASLQQPQEEQLPGVEEQLSRQQQERASLQQEMARLEEELSTLTSPQPSQLPNLLPLIQETRQCVEKLQAQQRKQEEAVDNVTAALHTVQASLPGSM